MPILADILGLSLFIHVDPCTTVGQPGLLNGFWPPLPSAILLHQLRRARTFTAPTPEYPSIITDLHALRTITSQSNYPKLDVSNFCYMTFEEQETNLTGWTRGGTIIPLMDR